VCVYIYIQYIFIYYIHCSRVDMHIDIGYDIQIYQMFDVHIQIYKYICMYIYIYNYLHRYARMYIHIYTAQAASVSVLSDTIPQKCLERIFISFYIHHRLYILFFGGLWIAHGSNGPMATPTRPRPAVCQVWHFLLCTVPLRSWCRGVSVWTLFWGMCKRWLTLGTTKNPTVIYNM
jgi:hypothetical protein